MGVERRLVEKPLVGVERRLVGVERRLVGVERWLVGVVKSWNPFGWLKWCRSKQYR